MAILLPYVISEGDTSNADKIQADLQVLADATSTGSGDVSGPVSSVDDNIVTFNGATGKIIQDGGSKISDLATSGHNHTGVYAPVLGADDNYVTDVQLQNINNIIAFSIAL